MAAAQQYTIFVVYPNADDLKFDMKYYLDTHMPLVDEIWAPAGLEKWEIVDFRTSSEAEKGPYSVAAKLTWKDEATFQTAAQQPRTAEIFADIPKFCNHQPIQLKGNIVASRS